MIATTTVPVTIEPKADARLDELGLRAEFERLMEFVRATVPELKGLEVEWSDPYDTGSEPGIHILARSGRPYDPEDDTTDRLRHWLIETFPPTVLQYFTLSYLPGAGHEG